MTSSRQLATHAMPSLPTLPLANVVIARGLWSESEHERFLDALKLYPVGPWRAIAKYIGTRSIKQVQTHAQKYQEKVERMKRGLRKHSKIVERTGHRVDNHARVLGVRFRRSSAEPTMPMPFASSALSNPPLSSGLVMPPALPFALASFMTPAPLRKEFKDQDADLKNAFESIEMEPLPYSPLTDLDMLWDIDQFQDPVELFLNCIDAEQAQ